MGFLQMIGWKLGPLEDFKPKDRAKMVLKHLRGKENEVARSAIKKSLEIMSNSDRALQKLWEAQHSHLMESDGVVWLNLVLELAEEDPSIVSEFPDLSLNVRTVRAIEAGRRDKLPYAKQLLLDAAISQIDHGNFFNPMRQVPRVIEAANDNDSQDLSGEQKAA